MSEQQTLGGRLKEHIDAWRPKNITGGAPFYPLFVLFGLNAVDEFDNQAFLILTPEIRDYFETDIEGILTLIALVGIATLVLGLVIGYYADRVNRVRIAAAGATTWGVFSVLTGVAQSLFQLGVVRTGALLGNVVNRPAHQSLLADYYPVHTRPAVYSFWRVAQSVGQFIGPLAAGVIAFTLASWRWPFIILAIPTFVFVMLCLRLKEPTRGIQDRTAAGASQATIDTAEQPPSWAESWRIVWAVPSLRRICYSLPFLATAFLGLGSLLNIYYEDVFGLNELERGIIAAATEPGQVLGVFILVPFVIRFAEMDPGRITRYVAAALAATAGFWLLLAVTPSFPVSVMARVLLAAAIGVVSPLVIGLLASTLPPRARAMGFTIVPLWYLPGLLILPVIGGLADTFGIRFGMLAMIPIFLAGAAVLTTAGPMLGTDIRKVRTATATMAEVRRAREQGELKLLVVRDLDVSYTGTQVLFGVDFEVGEGEIVALLGTNGAGKSTLLKAISGLVEPDQGAIVFDGRDFTHTPPNETASHGVIQVPGGKGIFPDLTVGENLRLAGWMYRHDPGHVKEATRRVLDEYFPQLADRLEEPAGNLSGGQQQMLTLSMAFIARPKLLMIDELSLGLAPVIVERLLDIVRAIHAQGTTIILVEQSVNIALTVAQTAYFMEKGEIRFRGPTRELLERPDILRSVFLEGVASVGSDGVKKKKKLSKGPHQRREGDVILEARGLVKNYGGVLAVDDVSFDVRKGEILGIIGPNGAGKTTLFDLISGFETPDGGSVHFDGLDVTAFGADGRARLGLGRSFQDAKLFPALKVEETIAVALERWVRVRDPIAAALGLPSVADSEAEIMRRVEELIELMGLGAFRDKFVSELSTGSRRIVDLACVLAHEPEVILFDEPSSGIAQRETEALGPLLRRVNEATGASLVVIEHDMPLVTTIAEEIIALDLGRVVVRDAPDVVVSHPHVVASYLGTSEEATARSGVVAVAQKVLGGDGARKKSGGRKKTAKSKQTDGRRTRRPTAKAKAKAKPGRAGTRRKDG